MDKELKQLLIDEIKENRKAIGQLSKDIAKLDKDVFSNKMKLSIFISAISIFFSIIITLIAEKLKHILI